MGGTSQVLHTKITETVTNDVVQKNQQNCIAQSVADTSGNTIIINGSTIDGNVSGTTTKTSTDATCLMTSTIEDTVENILQNVAQQNSSISSGITDFMSKRDQDIDYDLSVTVQNSILQMSEQGCVSSSISSTTNNYIYVGDSKIGGDFLGFSNDSKANASCSMTNVMKNEAYNSLQTKVDQTAKASNMFAMLIGIAIIIFVLLGVVGVVVVIVFVGPKMLKGGQAPGGMMPGMGGEEDDEGLGDLGDLGGELGEEGEAAKGAGGAGGLESMMSSLGSLKSFIK